MRPVGDVNANRGGLLGRRCGNGAHGMGAGRADTGVRRPGQIEQHRPRAIGRHGPQLGQRPPHGRYHHRVVVAHRVAGIVEHPRRAVHLGVELEHRRQVTAVEPIEVPPAVVVAHHVEAAVGTPLGLHHRAHSRYRALAVHPQLGLVPGHVGVVPLHPRQPLPVGAGSGPGVEIGASGHDLRLARAVAAQPYNLVGLLQGAALLLGRPGCVVVLPNAHRGIAEGSAIGVAPPVGEGGLGGYRAG